MSNNCVITKKYKETQFYYYLLYPTCIDLHTAWSTRSHCFVDRKVKEHRDICRPHTSAKRHDSHQDVTKAHSHAHKSVATHAN